ncbi:hypothetical protein [Endozoicomonas sp. GU-1]|uniref:hypothetical protein n=1 Tax=Endozoicomonas sp. GU-1 TaxID=3009078 RepID=UPI0022B5C70C|nr:hypothetical protein [Endozoicomonas sp. GU-1]WBA81565.1 hypothetical protein O2T12_25395 [Endozoicomonas sp. GU-1]WBA84518.1 hypothetical protein O3276_14575 [Endozoicomonas sp. GU-1]
MKDFGKVSGQFWISDDIQSLSDKAKLLALYLLTTGHGNLIGIFRMPKGYIAADLNWDEPSVERAIAELTTSGFLLASDQCQYICIPQFMEHNPVDNITQIDARLKLLVKLPQMLLEDLPGVIPVIERAVAKASDYKGSKQTEALLEYARKMLGKCSAESRLENKRNREKENKRNLYKTYVRSDDRTTPRTGEVPSSAGSTTGATAKNAKSGKADFSESFEEWWSQYPKREGDKGNKTKTFGHYKTRLREGHSCDDLLANILNYARYCDETGATGTQYVKTTTTYLNNPDNASNPWMVNYEARQRNSGKLSLVEQVEQANAHILQPERTGNFSGGNIYDVEPERSGDSVFDHDGPVRPEVDQCLRSG